MSTETDDAGRPLETGGLFTLVLPVSLLSAHFETELGSGKLRAHTAVQYSSTAPDAALGYSADDDGEPLARGATGIREFLPQAEALLLAAAETALPVFTSSNAEMDFYQSKESAPREDSVGGL